MKTLTAEELHQEGVKYYNGDGVKKDITKAIACFEQAIALGSTASKRALAYILLGEKSAWDAKTDDEKRGVQLYEQAAEEGDRQAREWYILQYGSMTTLFKMLKGEPAKRRAALAKQYLEELNSHS